MNENEKTVAEKTGKPASEARSVGARALSQNFFEYGKVPPQALDLEEAVLGGLLLEQNALTAVVDFLKPDVFYMEAHKKIYSAIQDLFAKQKPIDLLTVTHELKSKGDLEIVGGAYYIAQLTRRVASAANIEYHARIIVQKYIQRRLIEISSEITKDAFEDTMDVFDLLDKAEQKLFSVSENNLRRDHSDMLTLVSEAVKYIEKAKDSDGSYRGVPSGFSQLDRITAGWQNSDLLVLAARPGMGKTAFVLSMARNITVDLKRPVAVFSLEMSSIQLVTRLISSETRLPADKLKKGELKEHEWQQLNSRLNNLMHAPLYIDDTPALTIFELRAKARRMKQQYNIELIIIDYIQLMQGSVDKGNREQEISNISRSLKSLAKELDIPIIALSQLNRSVETRTGTKKPILSDLRESGAIEQDADMVLFIYRPEYYKFDQLEDGTPAAGVAQLIIAKHRNGALAEINLRFNANYAQFTDFDDVGYDASSNFYPNENFESNTMIVQSKMNDEVDSDDDLSGMQFGSNNDIDDLADDGLPKDAPF
jgi:replicative DNA helicase